MSNTKTLKDTLSSEGPPPGRRPLDLMVSPRVGSRESRLSVTYKGTKLFLRPHPQSLIQSHCPSTGPSS